MLLRTAEEVFLMKRLILGTALVLAASAGLAAQQSTTKTQTKVDVKDGKNGTVTGCVDRAASGPGFVLTRVESGGTPSPFYTLVGEDAALSHHVGHLVEIRGKATDVGDDGKVDVTTKTKVEREHGDDTHSKTKTQIEGATDVPFLGVKSVKMLRDSCS
jgi:hypothetical protein